jgi:hypothetical protein
MDEEADRDSRVDRKRSYNNEYNEEYDRGRVSQHRLWANGATSCMKAPLLSYIIPVPHVLTILCTVHFIVVQTALNQR